MENTPEDKKVLLFSATMPRGIMNIVKSYMKEYDMIAIKAEDKTNKNIEQKYFEVSRYNKFDALCRIIETQKEFYSIVFCRTKADVDDVASRLI
jgi:ATP-dependent RNA helicase DeaD